MLDKNNKIYQQINLIYDEYMLKSNHVTYFVCIEYKGKQNNL